jgi:hypothetical protein
MTRDAQVSQLSRRDMLKTYAAPSIAVIGVTAVGSFSTSGRVVLKKNEAEVGLTQKDEVTGKKVEVDVKVQKGK